MAIIYYLTAPIFSFVALCFFLHLKAIVSDGTLPLVVAMFAGGSIVTWICVLPVIISEKGLAEWKPLLIGSALGGLPALGISMMVICVRWDPIIMDNPIHRRSLYSGVAFLWLDCVWWFVLLAVHRWCVRALRQPWGGHQPQTKKTGDAESATSSKY
ncbi:hypothetical protein BOTBODRAFT_145738 [Botryobasidium botryosum FD-172 SS1]|uniref:Uncharacterized protein n=1 Tax=Botryobasidium botryosum (strain FD-172 SS1) TaxID=930990 RepID=A0A067MF45_BOTB1|nr:hypothetical protein BOTBODRAFT_145738 [Botryobasidium botryosum FD-172 SS1]